MDSESLKTGSSTYHVDKLTESNYRGWTQQIRWILDDRDLREVVDGGEGKPQQTSTQESANDREQLQTWAKKARSIIGSSISAAAMVYIEGIDDPAQMWKILSDRFNPKTQTTLIQLVKQLTTTKMDEGMDTMESHLIRMRRLKHRIAEQGGQISDNVYNGILLSSVPIVNYGVAVNILEAQENLTPAIIDSPSHHQLPGRRCQVDVGPVCC